MEWERAAWIAYAATNAQRDRAHRVPYSKMNPYRRRKRKKGTRNLRSIGKAMFGIDIEQVKAELGI